MENYQYLLYMEEKKTIKQEEVKEPNAEIVITFKDKKFPISYPTNGQLIDMEVYKGRLSSNEYSRLQLASIGNEDSSVALRLIETISTFKVLLPDLEKELKEKDYIKSNLIDMYPLLHAYAKVYHPWMENWKRYITQTLNTLSKDLADSK